MDTKTPKYTEDYYSILEDLRNKIHQAEDNYCIIFNEVSEKISRLEQDNKRFSECFERIARAIGIDTPLILIANAQNDDENYAEILTRIVEEKFAKK